MPMFSAVALDRLLDSGNPKSMIRTKSAPPPKGERINSAHLRSVDKRNRAPSSRMERGISRKRHWAATSPALYALPKCTPLPDSPSSYPPSPYIINHKRRGPRLLKSLSHDDVAIRQCTTGVEKCALTTQADDISIPKEENSVNDDNFSVAANTHGKEGHMSSIGAGEKSYLDLDDISAAVNGTGKSMDNGLQQNIEADNLIGPQGSMSIEGNADAENVNGGLECCLSYSTQAAEFYDAYEEISPDGGELQPASRDLETELREIKLRLLMETEKHKRAEEALNHMRMQWQRIGKHLLPIGLTLPDLVEEDQQLGDAVKSMVQELHVARYVSNSIGRGMAKAEAEEVMDGQIELKNFEIARLWDKLHYYETVNREMSQRNQEAVEITRRDRQKRKRRQRWIWGSVAASLTIGSAVLAWSYFRQGGGSSSSSSSSAHQSGPSSDSSGVRE
ncbi:unnamed protein product [Cuscuta campestris]|uniref:Uncharacterized protein n=2 Tax=Cuscuta sect. Cleistogrammica TaxID=1824901 RepID=A0A484MZ20_9ASTE|nr:hypothetical protein DM860_017229 [Cuscuta australis]VFQ93436.1 unnamed protein product [Cuscuta campestris]